MTMISTGPKGKTWYGGRVVVELHLKHGTYSFYNYKPAGYGLTISGEINSSDEGEPTTNTITIYNLSKKHRALFKVHDHVVIKGGSKSTFGILSEGDISKIQPITIDGVDRAFSFTFTEGKDYSKLSKIYNQYAGYKEVKHSYKTSDGKTVTWTSRKKKKINIRFSKNVKAKTIIGRICRSSGIKISVLHLKKNKVYKRGYTLSDKPFDALKKLAKDCGSVMYYRRGSLVIDDHKKPSLYATHLYLTLKDGLTAEPTVNDSDGKKPTYSLSLYLNSLITVGSIFYVDSETVKGLVRTKNTSTGLDDGLMSAEVVRV
ncbi:hypothetical protein [Lactobacillus brevis] [Lactiplantibacillus mudanjiangensis]|uniref:hypothetical protein n=1 Tax=Lactiplantibacillus mudanjiangensis TaxID=1296538 RepID=UPI0010157E17|nr:hypothetical protein [Lactiplantibacillus mudanjiangensis]VDG32889.1 hypothetical protein [Lactobacillus brevis] [Lactiplantibacillus mudanjiangensis]